MSVSLKPNDKRPHDPARATPSGFYATGSLGCSPFARHYSGNRYCFLFLRVLRWFSSPGSLHRTYEFGAGRSWYFHDQVSPFGHLRI